MKCQQVLVLALCLIVVVMCIMFKIYHIVWYCAQITLIFGSRPSDHYFRSVCWFVCLSVCLCRVFPSRLWSDFDQTWTYVICLGL